MPRIPKNDAPNRFWASVEPYCADITNEEVRTLEELLKPPEDEAEHYKIPPLGKHYSQRWAQEDLLEEQKDGARAAAVADKKKGLLGPLTELDTKGRPLASLPTPGQIFSSQSCSPPVHRFSVRCRCGCPAEEV